MNVCVCVLMKITFVEGLLYSRVLSFHPQSNPVS